MTVNDRDATERFPTAAEEDVLRYEKEDDTIDRAAEVLDGYGEYGSISTPAPFDEQLVNGNCLLCELLNEADAQTRDFSGLDRETLLRLRDSQREASWAYRQAYMGCSDAPSAPLREIHLRIREINLALDAAEVLVA